MKIINLISLSIILVFCTTFVYAQCPEGAFLDSFTDTCVCSHGANQDGSCVIFDPNAVSNPACPANMEFVPGWGCQCADGYYLVGLSQCEPIGTPDSADFCGVNEYADTEGYCYCNPGYIRTDQGCVRDDYCGSHGYLEVTGECICDSGYKEYTPGVGCEKIEEDYPDMMPVPEKLPPPDGYDEEKLITGRPDIDKLSDEELAEKLGVDVETARRLRFSMAYEREHKTPLRWDERVKQERPVENDGLINSDDDFLKMKKSPNVSKIQKLMILQNQKHLQRKNYTNATNLKQMIKGQSVMQDLYPLKCL